MRPSGMELDAAAGDHAAARPGAAMGPLVVYTPLIDRYAYAWMWWHGAWDVVPRGDSTAGAADGSHPASAPD
jgi:hypothetical protein